MTTPLSRQQTTTMVQLEPFIPADLAIEIVGTIARRQAPVRDEPDDRVVLSYRLENGKQHHDHEHIDVSLAPEIEMARFEERKRRLKTAQRVDTLALSFRLTGDMGKILVPELTPIPKRQNNLWQHTCFEFFLGTQGEPGYWEFNLSPSGDWNVYRLSAYRENLTPEPAYDALPFTVIVTESFCELALELDLSGIVSSNQAIEVGITTVVEEKPEPGSDAGRISYWAIAHTGPEADFHRRDSFTLQL